MHINVMNKKTDGNRPLKVSEIKENLESLRVDIVVAQADRVVALGKTAAKALTLLGVNFYEMPHPSGQNRLLNDPKYVEEKIKGLIEYCNPTSPEVKSN
jgi:uracil-DNA glycosylase